jgi:hypothetical protein
MRKPICSNKPAAGNAGAAPWLTIGHHWLGVPEPRRWAARRGAPKIFQKAIAAEIGARNLFRFNLNRSTAKETEVRAP